MKKLILRCDDFGSALGANDAILDLAQRGLTLNVSVLICGPVARTRLEELARFAPRVCLGIHAAVSSEWNEVKWGPVGQSARATGLVGANGYFPPTTEHILSLPMEIVESEIRSQIEEALKWNVPFSYLDEHMGFAWREDHRSCLQKLAVEFGLVYRPALPGLAWHGIESESFAERWDVALQRAVEGPNLLVLHPVLIDTSTRILSIGSGTPGVEAEARFREYEAVKSEAWHQSLHRQQVQLLTYRDLG